MDNTWLELRTLRELVRVCRALNDEAVALEYCEHALKLTEDDPHTARWFEGVYALLTETSLQTRYTHGLITVLDDEFELATDLFE